jgi:hypothetical protein
MGKEVDSGKFVFLAEHHQMCASRQLVNMGLPVGN